MISVCIATYNGEKYLQEQIDSIIIQLYDCDELVVSDDGSSDGTLAILESYSDSRIKILHNTVRHGVIGNFENALRNAKGDFIFLADQDDIWLNDKVSVSKEALKESDLVVSDCYVTDTNLNIIEPSFFKINNAIRNKWGGLFKRNPYSGSCMAFKREVLTKSLPFPKNIPMHDIWIGNVAAFFFSVSFIKEKLIFYRRHVENVTPTGGGVSSFSFAEKIKYRFIIISNLLKKIKL